MSVPSMPKPQTLTKDHYQPAEQLDDRELVEVVFFFGVGETIATVKNVEGIDQWVLFQCLKLSVRLL